MMPVYVDNEKSPFGRMKMCHMVADTLAELHSMASKIGMKRHWFQMRRGGMPHYDVCQSKRLLAISFGAVEVNRFELVAVMREYRERVVVEK